MIKILMGFFFPGFARIFFEFAELFFFDLYHISQGHHANDLGFYRKLMDSRGK